MLNSLRRLALYRRPIAVLAAASSTIALIFAAGGLAAFEPTVQIVGCSNSHQIAEAYLYASAHDAAVNSAQGGMSLKQWATESSPAWAGDGTNRAPGFDANFGAHGASAVWYPLCIRTTDYASNSKAWAGFKAFLANLRKRTSAPLYLSATIGAQPSCAADDEAEQQYVTNRAISEGLALPGPDVAPASVPQPDTCHFVPRLSTNIQDTAVAFLDG
jgi:hypothetical protein